MREGGVLRTREDATEEKGVVQPTSWKTVSRGGVAVQGCPVLNFEGFGEIGSTNVVQ
jgi:hypothetical protein